MKDHSNALVAVWGNCRIARACAIAIIGAAGVTASDWTRAQDESAKALTELVLSAAANVLHVVLRKIFMRNTFRSKIQQPLPS